MTHPTSRRDRKRAATRDALRENALRLFAERGFTATTVTDITDSIDVSERTFFRYFATKEDVLYGDLIELRPRLLEALADRPPDEPPLTAILAALSGLHRSGRPGQLAALTPPAGTAPTGRMLQVFAEWESGLIEVLLAREPSEHDEHAVLRAEVTARAALAALRSAANRYRAVADPADESAYAALVVEAFNVLAQGCSARQ